MARVFAYCRVSTADQTTDNQLQEIAASGFAVEPKRVVTETVSGSLPTCQRKGFSKLRDRMEADDVLVVTKLDRLGRNAIDVQLTVRSLGEQGVRVHCLQLGGADLTSAAGKMVMGVLTAVAEFERDLLIERTQAGLRRAKSEGKALGRRSKLTPSERDEVRTRRVSGQSFRSLAAEFGVSRTSIERAAKTSSLQAERPK